MNRFHLIVWVLSALLLQSCASTTAPVAGWADDLPDSAVFIRAWNQDGPNQQLQSRDDYLLWVQRFYRGFNLASGWNDMTGHVLARLDPERRLEVRARLQQLGIRVGQEWAKSNNLRRINTRMASAWREALLEALREDDLPHFLAMFEADLEALLAGKLQGNEIAFERYYVDDFDF